MSSNVVEPDNAAGVDVAVEHVTTEVSRLPCRRVAEQQNKRIDVAEVHRPVAIEVAVVRFQAQAVRQIRAAAIILERPQKYGKIQRRAGS